MALQFSRIIYREFHDAHTERRCVKCRRVRVLPPHSDLCSQCIAPQEVAESIIVKPGAKVGDGTFRPHRKKVFFPQEGRHSR